MEFVEKMKEAMLALSEACQMNTSWRDCGLCPFADYCNVIEEAGLWTPEEWWIKR